MLLFDGVLTTPAFQALGVQHATGRRLTLAALLVAHQGMGGSLTESEAEVVNDMKWQAQGVRESERFGRLAQADPLLDRPSFAHACGIEVVGTAMSQLLYRAMPPDGNIRAPASLTEVYLFFRFGRRASDADRRFAVASWRQRVAQRVLELARTPVFAETARLLFPALARTPNVGRHHAGVVMTFLTE
jgi:hypothetical protein